MRLKLTRRRVLGGLAAGSVALVVDELLEKLPVASGFEWKTDLKSSGSYDGAWLGATDGRFLAGTVGEAGELVVVAPDGTAKWTIGPGPVESFSATAGHVAVATGESVIGHRVRGETPSDSPSWETARDADSAVDGVDLAATGDVFVCRGERDLWGIDAASGEVRWHRAQQGPENAPETFRKFFIGHDGRGYVASSGELDEYVRLTAVDPTTGEFLWHYEVSPEDVGGVYFDDAATAGDKIVLTLMLEPYTGASDEENWEFLRYVLDGNDGNVRDERRTAHPGPPIADTFPGDDEYFDERLQGLSESVVLRRQFEPPRVADPGTLEPRFALDAETFGEEVTGMSFGVDGDTLYVAGGVKGDGEHVTAIRCYAFDARDGTKHWAKTLQYRKHMADRNDASTDSGPLFSWLRVDAAPRVVNGTVGVLTNTGHLFGIDVED